MKKITILIKKRVFLPKIYLPKFIQEDKLKKKPIFFDIFSIPIMIAYKAFNA